MVKFNHALCLSSYLFDLNEDRFLVLSLSPGAFADPDVQAVVHSMAIDPGIPVNVPDTTPGYPLGGVISDCKGANELEVLITGPKSLRWGSGQVVKVHLALINQSPDRLYVLDWFTPFEGFAGDLFRIMYNGQPLEYQGVLAERDDPSSGSYMLIESGGALTVEVNLSSFYDFSRPGIYSIAYKSPPISDVAASETEFAASFDELGPIYIPSNEITVKISLEE
jgi:hypothetical protein